MFRGSRRLLSLLCVMGCAMLSMPALAHAYSVTITSGPDVSGSYNETSNNGTTTFSPRDGDATIAASTIVNASQSAQTVEIDSSSGADENVSINTSLGLASDCGLTLNAVGNSGEIDINSTVRSGKQVFDSPVKISASNTLVVSQSDQQFASSLTFDASAASAVVEAAGAESVAGDVVMQGQSDGVSAQGGSLTVTGGVDLNGSSEYVSSQAGLTIGGSVQMSGGSNQGISAGTLLTLGGAVGATTADSGTLNLQAQSISFGGPVGSAGTPLGDVYLILRGPMDQSTDITYPVNARSLNVLSGGSPVDIAAPVTTSAGQDYDSAVSLGENAQLDDSGSGSVNFEADVAVAQSAAIAAQNVVFHGAVDGSAVGSGGGLSFGDGTSGSSTVEFLQPVGATYPLASLTFAQSASANFEDNAPNGPLVSTTGTQSYGAVSIANQATLSSSDGGAISFNGAINDFDAALTAQTSGRVVLSAPSPYLSGSFETVGATLTYADASDFGTAAIEVDGGKIDTPSAPGANPDISPQLSVMSPGQGDGVILDVGSSSPTFADQIHGNARVTETGSGKLTLAGSDALPAQLDVTNGYVDVTGSLDQPVTVDQAGTLIVSGSVQDTSGTAISVDPAGLLKCDGGTIDGSVTAQSGGTLQGAPDSPTGVNAAAGDGQAQVSFAPNAAHCYPITYTATASPGGQSATSAPFGSTSPGSPSPLTVTGLTDNQSYTFAVKATNPIGSVTSQPSGTVTPESGSPTATLSSPTGGRTYGEGAHVPTSFSCQEASGGPGISSCEDSNMIFGPTDGSSQTGALDTTTPGQQTYSVTATSKDGEHSTSKISYTVAGPPSAAISSPANHQTFTQGQSVTTTFSCQAGTDGAAVSSCVDQNGKTSPATLDTSTPGTHTYTVTATAGDQTGTAQISYTVTAANPPTTTTTTTATTPTATTTTATTPSTTTSSAIAAPSLAVGPFTAHGLAPLVFGLTSAQARALPEFTSSITQPQQLFFFGGTGLTRAGIASSAMLTRIHARDSGSFTGRVVWILTTDTADSVHGIRPGMTVTQAAEHLGLPAAQRVGANDWYLAPDGSVTAMLRVQNGVVLEVGTAVRSLSDGPRQRRFGFLEGF